MKREISVNNIQRDSVRINSSITRG